MSKSNKPDKSEQTPLSSKQDNQTNKDERLPHCQRCAQHNVRNRLRGHKSICPFRSCECAKCLIVLERQRLMADQIKLRRQQRKQRNLHKIRQQLEQNIKQTDPIQKPPNHIEQQPLPINTNFPFNSQYFSIFGLQSLFNKY